MKRVGRVNYRPVCLTETDRKVPNKALATTEQWWPEAEERRREGGIEWGRVA